MAHVLTDLYASIAAALSGVLILLTGVGEFDGIAALVVAALMVASGWRLLRDASARAARGRADRASTPTAIGRDARGPARHRRGPRPAHLGGHVGLPRRSRRT